MSDQNAKQQIIDQLKDVENVLVTVNRNPSVDELSAALGFTLLVNKLNKHATAVFSGAIPPAITFLDPEKTFENTVDSLRDFIIALDKEKADHLRYKVDGDMVKIFITPYRTTISDKDLEFSQGDYNVEMVVAIGVQNEEDLDHALSDHGRIMHDATVVAVGNGEKPGKLGTINWDEAGASSYSEMLASLADGLRTDKNLLDEQIATAFLTGIVAATERFSNQRTTSRSMTVAAELMAAGANQQLIASRLEEAGGLSSSTDGAASSDDDTAGPSDDGSSLKVDRSSEPADEAAEPVKDEQAADGTMTVSHEKQGDLDAVALQTLKEQQAAATEKAEEELAANLATSSADVPDKPSVADIQGDLQAAANDIDESIEPPHVDEAVLPPPAAPDASAGPAFGGILNATSEQAAEDKRRADAEDRNKTILSHDGAQYVGNPPVTIPPLNSYGSQPAVEPGVPSAEMLEGEAPLARATPVEPPTPEPSVSDNVSPAAPVATDAPTLAEIDQQNRGNAYQDAQAAISAALDQPTVAPDPAAAIQPGGALPPMPPMPDFSTLPPLPTDNNNPFAQPAAPQTPEEMLSSALGQPASPPLPTSGSTPADPGQFRIPGQ